MMKGKKQQIGAAESFPLGAGALGLPDGEYQALARTLARGPLESTRGVVVGMGHRPTRALPGLSRTALGVLAPTVWESLGVFDSIERIALASARPFCASCGQYATRARDVDLLSLPARGYLAFVVSGVRDDFPLREQCELLGSERALIEDRIVRLDEIDDRVGEPVLGIFDVTRHREARQESSRWFERGGATLRVVYFADRGGTAKTLGHLSRDWVCSLCEGTFPDVTVEALENAPNCARCRGEGWLSVEEGRLVACQECHGYGATSPLLNYHVGPRNLATVAGMSLGELRESLEGRGEIGAAPDLRVLNELCESDFSEYPLGTADFSLSAGERARLVRALAEKGGETVVRIAFDAGALGGEEKIRDDERGEGSSSIIFGPRWLSGASRFEGMRSTERLLIADVFRGPLRLSKMEFALGEATLLQGLPGAGKSLLLSEIARRFAKRRKNPAAGRFGPLKSLHHVDGGSIEEDRVISLIQLEEDFARMAASARHAKELGAVAKDFMLGGSRYPCSECSDDTVIGEDACDACGGSGFSGALQRVELGGVPLLQLMTAPLSDSLKALWTSDRCAELSRLLPTDLGAALRLGQRVLELSPTDRRFLRILGGLVAVTAQPKKIKETLILLDNPFGIQLEYQRVVATVIRELIKGGATIICAGVPAALENLFSNVVRFRTASAPERGGERDRFFDSRFARVSVVVEGEAECQSEN